MKHKVCHKGTTFEFDSSQEFDYAVIAKLNSLVDFSRSLTKTSFVMQNAEHYSQVIRGNATLLSRPEFQCEDSAHLVSLGYGTDTEKNAELILEEYLSSYLFKRKLGKHDYSIAGVSRTKKGIQKIAKKLERSGLKTIILKLSLDGTTK